MKKFTPDQQLIFDAESSKLRWFLLPSEAKQYLLGELITKIKDPVFLIRKEYSPFNMNSTNDNNSIFNTPVISQIDENSNIFNEIISNTDSVIAEKANKDEFQNEKQQCCLLRVESRSCTSVLPSNERKGKWHSPPTRIFNPFLKVCISFYFYIYTS